MKPKQARRKNEIERLLVKLAKRDKQLKSFRQKASQENELRHENSRLNDIISNQLMTITGLVRERKILKAMKRLKEIDPHGNY